MFFIYILFSDISPLHKIWSVVGFKAVDYSIYSKWKECAIKYIYSPLLELHERLHSFQLFQAS